MLSPIAHRLRIEKLYSTCAIRAKDRNLEWTGHLQPSPLSIRYKVRIAYRLGKRPVVTIIEPCLERLEGERLPHVYEKDELCLYYPGEWSGKSHIADTIIPWISEWLLHYEIWLATGGWQGGGEHPSTSDKSNTTLLVKRAPDLN